MEEPQETTSSVPDPMAFTKERLSEISEVWVEFAKQQAEAYKAKLPDAVKQYLKPKGAPSEPETDASDMPESGAA